MESTYSLQGSYIGARDSPKPVNRRIERIPLYLNEDSHTTLENPEAENPEQNDTNDKRPLAVVRPRHILRSIASSDEYSQFTNSSNLIRHSRSLDPFPSIIRRRSENTKLLQPKNKKKDLAASLEHGFSNISSHPSGISEHKTNNKEDDMYKYPNNNCNGSIGNDDPDNSPLIRQTSVTNNDAEDVPFLTKRWRSLEEIALDEETSSKTSITKRSLKSWLAGILHGNGFKSSDASLRKVNPIQPSTGLLTFNEIQANVQKESIV